MPDIEYYYSAHSAFAYLGSARLMEIADAARCRIVHKPVNLNKVIQALDPDGFAGRSKAHVNYYFAREIERWAEYRGVAFKGGIPPNHRYDMTLANCMLIAGIALGQNVDRLAHALLQVHWEHFGDLSDEAVLLEAAVSVDLDGTALIKAARLESTIKAYQTNTLEAIERSVFGSPTYFVDGDMFYGQDRLEFVARALSQPFARTWPEI